MDGDRPKDEDHPEDSESSVGGNHPRVSAGSAILVRNVEPCLISSITGNSSQGIVLYEYNPL